MFEIFFGVGALLLLAALMYGVFRYNRRDPANEAITEKATRESYRDPERYEKQTRDELAGQLR